MSDLRQTSQTQDVLRRAFVEIRQLKEEVRALRTQSQEPVAIVGIGCTFPGGVDSPYDYWKFLRDGGVAVADIPSERWDEDRYFNARRGAPGAMYVKRGGVLTRDIRAFDAKRFGISPQEAASMDPQQRLLLETTCAALDDAAIDASSLRESLTGVFAGIIVGEYAQAQSLAGAGPRDIDGYRVLGNVGSVASGRISYLLGCQGPSVSIDAACASSLVSVHLASRSLRSRECDLAIAGGVSLMISPGAMIGLCSMGALSSDGRCHTFDERADGYGRGEGSGVVILKRLSDAIRDRDSIWAVVRGSALNHDGPSSGMTVPNAGAQRKVIERALADAQLSPDKVGYIEAHGTGTALGDPIEVQALADVFAAGRDTPLYLGSAKANIGHLEAAAGIAGLIKAALCIRHGHIPPHPDLKRINPRLELERFRAEIPTTYSAWPRERGALVVGVSSFGFSGTNAHVLVGESEVEHEPEAAVAIPYVLPLSAADAEQLATRVAQYQQALKDGDPAQLCWHAWRTHGRQPYRRGVIGESIDELGQRLSELSANLSASAATPVRAGTSAWLFGGQGTQSPGMGSVLYATWPAFQSKVDVLDAITRQRWDYSLKELLCTSDSKKLSDTRFTQPALVGLQLGLCALWRSLGVTRPSAVLGHSLGEFTAAVVADVMSEEDALMLATERGRLMAELCARGAMLVVFAAESQVRERLGEDFDLLDVAARNGAEEFVLSGETGRVEHVERVLTEANIRMRRLNVSHAFHSRMIEPMLPTFGDVVKQVKLDAPKLAFYSTVEGRRVDAELQTAQYWATHPRRTVSFAAAASALLDETPAFSLEIGAGGAMSALLRKASVQRQIAAPHNVVTLRNGMLPNTSIAQGVAQLFEYGSPVHLHWPAPADGRTRRLPLPATKPEVHWFSAESFHAQISPASEVSSSAHEERAETSARANTELGLRRAGPRPLYEQRHAEGVRSTVFGKRVRSQGHVWAQLLKLANQELSDDCELVRLRGASAGVVPEPGPECECLRLEWIPGAADECGMLLADAKIGAAGAERWSSIGRAFAQPNPLTVGTSLDVADLVRGLDEQAQRIAGEAVLEEAAERGYEPTDLQGVLGEVTWCGNRVSAKLRLDNAEPQSVLALALQAGALLTGLIADAWSPTLPEAARTMGDELKGVLDAALKSAAPSYDWDAAERLSWSSERAPVRLELRRDADEYRLVGFDRANDCCLELSAARIRRFSRGAVRAGFFTSTRSWSYEECWTSVGVAPKYTLRDRELVLALAPVALSRAISERVNAADGRCHVTETCDGDAFDIDAVVDSTAHRDVVLTSWGFGALDQAEYTSGDDLDPESAERAIAMVTRVHGFLASFARRSGGGKIYLITAGGVITGQSDEICRSADASVWGLLRVFALEHPERWGGVLDLSSWSEVLVASEALCELVAAAYTGEDQIALRGGVRLVPRLTVRQPDASPPPTAQLQGTALITGGLGGIGLSLAEWVVQRGVRRVVLTTRRQTPAQSSWAELMPTHPFAEQAARLRTLMRQGVCVSVEQVDVCDAAAMRRLFEAEDSAGTPIRCVLHSAGITQPDLFVNLNSDTLRAVLRPKLVGGAVLHALCRDRALDLFLLMSSISSVWGSAGLAPYAAANRYLDVMADWRLAQGLTATAVNWGPWAEVGMTASEEELSLLERMGIYSLPTRGAFEVLDAIAGRNCPRTLVADMDWSRFKPIFEARANRPILKGVTVAADCTSSGQGFASLSATEIVDRISNVLREEIARALHLTTDAVSPTQTITALGMDSLMVMDVLARAQKRLELTIYPREVFDHPTVTALAAHLASQVNVHDTAPDAQHQSGPVTVATLVEMQREALAVSPAAEISKQNPPAVFLLSAPRSGSTLLRVMLAGHSKLFCPPELHLLPFQRLQDRERALAGSYMDEGLERAMMQLWGRDQARAELEAWQRDDLSIPQVYERLQTKGAPRLLVDKSPSYGGSLHILQRAETYFTSPKYIFLTRHPAAMVESFVNARIAALFGAVGEPQRVAEAAWVNINRNISDFLSKIEARRQIHLRYEELVRNPERAMRQVLDFLEVDFESSVLNPYEGDRMTDGITAKSKSIGDPNFDNHSQIEPELAERGREAKLAQELSPEVVALSATLEYSLAETSGANGGHRSTAGSESELSFERLRAAAQDVHSSPWASWSEMHCISKQTCDALELMHMSRQSAERLASSLPLDAPEGVLLARASGMEAGLLVSPVRDLSDGAVLGVVAWGLAPDSARSEWFAWRSSGAPLYGAWGQRKHIAEEDQVIVVPSPLDVLVGHTQGWKHLVCDPDRGRHLSEAQWQELRGLAEIIVGAEGVSAEQTAVEQRGGEVRGETTAGAQAEAGDLWGRFSIRSVASDALGCDLDVGVLQPPASAFDGRPFPLVLFLQGAVRRDSLLLATTVDRAMRQGSVRPCVFAFINGARGLYANHCDGGPRWEDAVHGDVRSYLLTVLDVPVARERTAICGASMGGLGALRIALRHPEDYRGVVAHMPALDAGLTWEQVPERSLMRLARPEQWLETVFGAPLDGNQGWTENNPAWIATQNAERIRKSGLRIHLDVGEQDHLAGPGTRFMHNTLAQERITHDFREYPGARHNAAFMSLAFLEGLRSLTTYLEG